jgi:hypothetical protein
MQVPRGSSIETEAQYLDDGGWMMGIDTRLLHTYGSSRQSHTLRFRQR